jgi:hypothetical protein
MRKYFFLLLILLGLQSCYYPVRKDYGIYSKSLVFSKDQKWLINNINTTVDAHHREMMTAETMKLFTQLSEGKAYDLKTAKSENNRDFIDNIEEFKNLLIAKNICGIQENPLLLDKFTDEIIEQD